MKIILIRHFEVNYRWKMFYNSVGYEMACKEYDQSGVVQSGIRINTEFRIITSTMIRSIETARLIFGKEPDSSDDSICEVPIKPFITTMIFPKIIWDVMGRIQWRLGVKKQPETYLESIRRVNEFIDKLVLQDQNCIVVCHGWIIKLMIKHLKLVGFSGPTPFFVKNGVPYEFQKRV
ncbi:MAG: histidine phosphatase family protein [Bacteroidota bacterium]|nr:histidine phosphatase family protein [Bacteroidota bacterium]